MTRARNIAGFSTITTTPSPVHVGPIGVLTATRIDGEFNVVDITSRDITAQGIGVTNLQVSGITTGLNVSGIITAQNGINFNGTSTGLNVSGVGTIATLSVTGNATIGGVLTYEDVTNVDSVGVITARTDINLGDSIIHIGDTNTKIRFPAADTITAETSGNERVRIDSNGAVNIGAEAANTTIQASGPFSGSTPKLEIKLGGASNSYARLINIANPSGATGSETLGRVGIKLALGDESNSTETAKAGIIYAESTSTYNNGVSLCLATNNTERLRITSTGFVGINETTPDRLLHITHTTTPYIRTTLNDTTVSANDVFGAWEFESLDSSTGSAGVIGKIDCIASAVFDGTSANGGAIRFHTSGTNSISLTERLRITADGKFGFNKSDPATDFVFKTTAAHTNLMVMSASESTKFSVQTVQDSDIRVGTQSNHPLSVYVNSLEKLRVTTDGNIIAGRSDFTYNDTSAANNTFLELYGGSVAGNRGILSLAGRTGSDDGLLGTIWFINGNNSSSSPGNQMKLSAAIQAAAVTSDGNAQNDAGGYLDFFTKADGGSAAAKMRLSEVGILNVSSTGLELDQTAYKFQVTGSGGGEAASMAIKNQGSHPAKLHLMSGHGNWSVGNSVTVGDALEFRDESAGATRMLIRSDGKVGVGNVGDANWQFKVSVAQNNAYQYGFNLTNLIDSDLTGTIRSSSAYWGPSTNTYLALGSGNTEVIRIDHDATNMIQQINGEEAPALSSSSAGGRGINLYKTGGTSIPVYFGSETNSAMKAMYLQGYWFYIRGHVNEGTRLIFSQSSGNAPHSSYYQFKYNSALRPGSSTTWDGFSDARAKENVSNITNGIETIKKLRPVNFDWTNDYADAEGMYIMEKDSEGKCIKAVKENGYDLAEKNNNVGFIAQEYETVLPKDVKENEFKLGETELTDFKTINNDSLFAYLTAALQEAVAKIETLESEVAALKGS